MTAEPPTPTRRPVPDDLFGGRLRGAYLLDLEVTEVRRIAEHVQLVSVGSTDLLGFQSVPGQDALIEFGDGAGSVRRRYTIRRVDPRTGMVDFEFELHPGGGAAAHWAASGSRGDVLSAIGPRGSIGLRAEAPEHLFVADDSAMPAVFATLEALPAQTRATALLNAPHGEPLR